MSDPAAILRADRVAAAIVSGAAPVRIDVARSPEARSAIFRLRGDVVVARGWARAEDLPGGHETDAHDDRSVLLGAWDREALVGAARIALPVPGRPLPVEEDFGLVVEPNGHVVELGRMCVAPSHRGAERRMFVALICRCWLEMRARGFSRACGAFEPVVARMYRAWGFDVTILGPARVQHGTPRHPVQVCPTLETFTRFGFATVPESTSPAGPVRSQG